MQNNKVNSCSELNNILLKCVQCGHEWKPRSEPSRCPKCKSYYWKKERLTIKKKLQIVNFDRSRTTFYYARQLINNPLVADLHIKLQNGEMKIYTAYRELKRREYIECVKQLEGV